MTLFEETFDILSGDRIVTENDYPIQAASLEEAAKLMTQYVRVAENHWTYTETDGSVTHIRLVDAA